MPDDTALLEDVSSVNDDICTRVSATRNFLKELSWTEIFLGTPISSLGALHNNDAIFSTFRTDWETWSRQASAIQEYLALLFRFKSKDVAQLTLAMTHIKRFREDFTQDPPPDSSRLLQLMTNVEKDLEERVKLAEKLLEANKLIASARNDFEAKRYAECRDTCNQLLTEYKPVLGRAVEHSVLTLKARAEVYVDTDLLSEIKLEELDPAKRLEKLEAFLSSVQGLDVDSLDEEDRRQVEAFRREAQIARTQVEAADQENHFLKELSDFRKDRSTSVSEKLTAALRLREQIQAAKQKIQDAPDGESLSARERLKAFDANHESLRAAVRTWFVRATPVIKTGMDDKIREAVHKDGTILCGYFREVREGDRVTGYKFYSSLREYENPTTSAGTHPAADFQSPPAVPMEKKLVDEYTGLRKKVLGGVESRGNWVEFHLACQKMERQLVQHAKNPGVKPGNVSFRQPEKLARLVLDTKNWEMMEKIFR